MPKSKPNSKHPHAIDAITDDTRTLVTYAANIEDEATGRAYNAYRIVKVGGDIATVEIERSKTADRKKFLAELMDRNTDLPSDRAACNALLDEVLKARPQAYLRNATHVGWRELGRSFVLHGGMIGEPGGDGRTLIAPRWIADQKHRTGGTGSLAGWKATVARKARWSSCLQLALSVAFAAPLLRIVGLQPFAIALCGRGKTGKTTALLAAGSVIGLGHESHMPKWGMTDAGFTETARLFNDLVFIVDETGTIEGHSKDAHRRIRHLVFQYAGGSDRARHSKSGYATSKAQGESRGILLASTEHSFGQYAQLAGEKRVDGEVARAIDIAVLEPGRATIIDKFPKGLAEADRTAWAAQKLAAIKRACAKHHGVAMPAYLDDLVACGPAAVAEKTAAAMADFTARLALKSDNQALHHAAKNMALVYAGGVLAIDADLLPVRRDRLLKNLVKLTRAALAAHAPAPIEPRALHQLAKRLSTVTATKAAAEETGAVAFWRGPRERAAGRVCCVKTTAFATWFENDAEVRAALAWLHRQGFLILRRDPRRSSAAPTITSATTFRKIGGASTRCVQFIDPRAALGGDVAGNAGKRRSGEVATRRPARSVHKG